MKGQGKFFIKMVYLILSIIIINIFVYQYISSEKFQHEITYKNEMKMAADNILNQLTLSEKCLAYKENVTVGDFPSSTVTHRILDIKKIETMKRDFSFYEPNCTKRYGFGYYLVIEKFNLTRLDTKRDDLPPINDKDIVVVIDATYSMKEGDKINYAKSAAKALVDCAADDNRVGIVVLKDCNDVDVFEYRGKKLIELDREENKNALKSYIDAIGLYGDTAIKDSLREANKILVESDGPQRYKMILLLTDGCETCNECACKVVKDPNAQKKCDYYDDYCESCPDGQEVCDFVRNNIDENIHLFTVGLFTDVHCKKEEEKGSEQLKCAARERNGKYYLALSTGRLGQIFCNLGKGVGKAFDEEKVWVIGEKSHSIGNSLKGSFFVSAPISIRYNETYVQSGRATLYLFDGELEKISYIINEGCKHDEYEGHVTLSYKTYIKRENNVNKVCMKDGEREFCKSIECKKEIEFTPLNPGTYHLEVSSDRMTVKVVV
ncbi:MAG: VWA domain-containing protein [Candidatus Aenigmarchaeota archaeon]|nr:VWA domain-containing protein [Candidatus Aenigmarchaeota archaeon]